MTLFFEHKHSAQIAAFLTVIGVSGCNAHDVPVSWKTECVGQMQISFPGDVEQAVTPRAVFAKEVKSWAKAPAFDSVPNFQFADGQPAGWSGMAFDGGLYVSEPMKSTDHKALESDVAKWGESRRSLIAKQRPKNKSGALMRYESLPTNGAHVTAWRVDDSFVAYFRLGDRGLLWQVDGGPGTRDVYETLSLRLRTRQKFEVPKVAGTCLPYAFIADSGKTRRYVATTYRLNTHPDITVLLKDVTAVSIDSKANPKMYDPEAESDSFWSRYDNIYRKSLRSVWSTPYKHIKLARSKGLESFVKIVRENDAIDYGYLVVARGDPKASEDTPDLMLYVIQESKNAKSKGIEPLNKDAFLELAQTISASVRPRSVAPQ